MKTLTVGSLFAGVGGFELAAEWMGWDVTWHSEIDEYASKIIAKRFPSTRDVGDITTWNPTENDGVDIVCGGFPCQPVSLAGKRLAQEDDRWLWPQFARVVRVLQPHYVVVENVPGLLVRGMGDVLRDLSDIGYDAEWQVISAANVGAPHLRKRVWIVAYPNRGRAYTEPQREPKRKGSTDVNGHGAVQSVADAVYGKPEIRSSDDEIRKQRPADGGRPVKPAWAGASRGDERGTDTKGVEESSAAPLADPDEGRRLGERRTLSEDGNTPRGHDASHRCDPGNGWQWWNVEPDVGRVANGVPARVDRLKCLGNAIVPLCAYRWAFQRIVALEDSTG